MLTKSGDYTLLGAHILSYVVLTNILVHSYVEYHVPIWGYLGYFVDYSPIRHIIANLGAVCLALLIPVRMVGLTSFTLTLVGSSTIAALLAMYATRGYSISYLISLLLFLLIVKLLATSLRFRIPPRKGSTVPIVAFTAGGLGVCVAWIVARGGLAHINFDIANIYSIREVAMERYFSGPFAYLLNWAQKGFGTALFALGLIKRSVVLVGFAVMVQVFFYASLGQKTPVAMLVFVVVAIFVWKYRPTAWSLNAVLIFLVLASEILFELLGYQGVVLNSLVVKRVFFATAEASILHFEFFSENAFTYFSDSILQGIVEYPFDLSVMDLISIMMTGESGVNLNVGIIATGYQNMGYPGLLLYAALSGLILAIFESLSKDLPSWGAYVHRRPAHVHHVHVIRHGTRHAHAWGPDRHDHHIHLAGNLRGFIAHQFEIARRGPTRD